jgi:regulator of protease activity HflC (stomatin/prohibitin superfamily)
LFKNVGANYEDLVINPTIHEATKASVAQFKAQDLINEREKVRASIEDLLRSKLAKYNIVVEQVSITDFDFSDQFNQAIESKVTAEQDKLKAENVLARIKVEAEQAVAQAEGQKQAQIAIAQGEAEKIRLLQQQLSASPQYIELQKVQKWSGTMPLIIMGGEQSGTTLIDVSSLITQK